MSNLVLRTATEKRKHLVPVPHKAMPGETLSEDRTHHRYTHAPGDSHQMPVTLATSLYNMHKHARDNNGKANKV